MIAGTRHDPGDDRKAVAPAVVLERALRPAPQAALVQVGAGQGVLEVREPLQHVAAVVVVLLAAQGATGRRSSGHGFLDSRREDGERGGTA